MLDRASTFADPEIVQLLKTRFVPVAIDQAYQRRQQDAEGDFYRQIAGQGPRNNFKSTTQGFYLAAADGTFLGYNNNRGPDRVKRLMQQVLAGFRPPAAAAINPGRPDARFHLVPPAGGLVVRVHAKVLGGYPEATDRWQQIFQSAVSRDNLWITAAEHRALVRGSVPASLQRRLARFHLVDNTRGEPPMWKASEIRKLNLKLDDGRLTGAVHLETDAGDRGYQVELLGFVETTAGQVTRLDVIAQGQFWGEGRYTRGAPRGKFPLAVSFTLATGDDIADRVPPQGARGWLRGYIE